MILLNKIFFKKMVASWDMEKVKTVGSNLQKKEIYSVIEKIKKLQITIEMETTNEKNMNRGGEEEY